LKERALITGGSRGLGLVLARQLAAEGARLTLLARLLRGAAGPNGDVAQPGRAIGSDWTASKIFAPMYAAAQRNNEL
jgi:NAD(P)-dependent dehydrogenase (short-subunit alcohol dehydrogenase family)